MYGVIVDEVIQIINITNDFQTIFKVIEDEVISGKFVLSNEVIPLINIQLLINSNNKFKIDQAP